MFGTFIIIGMPLLCFCLIFSGIKGLSCSRKKCWYAGAVIKVSLGTFVLTWLALIAFVSWRFESNLKKACGPFYGKADSKFSQKGFVKILDFMPPKGINKIKFYCYGFTDTHDLLCFNFTTRNEIDLIIDKCKLEKTTEPFDSSEEPVWWVQSSHIKYQAYANVNECLNLWVDNENKIAFVRQHLP